MVKDTKTVKGQLVTQAGDGAEVPSVNTKPSSVDLVIHDMNLLTHHESLQMDLSRWVFKTKETI